MEIDEIVQNAIDKHCQERNYSDKLKSKLSHIVNRYRAGAVETSDLGVFLNQIKEILEVLPNIPSSDTPEGLDEASNKEIKIFGNKPIFSFNNCKSKAASNTIKINPTTPKTSKIGNKLGLTTPEKRKT